MINKMIILVIFPFLDGDVSRSPFYGVCISEPFVLRENVLQVMFKTKETHLNVCLLSY